MHIKESLYSKCQEFIDKRLQTHQNTIIDIQKALLSETKSSAGDKHETGRAMLQLEREKVGQQLAEINKIKVILKKINLDSRSNTIALGSIVQTSQLNYFLSISAGEILVDNKLFYAISTSTPIGKLLLGKRDGDAVLFNGVVIEIKKIE